MRLIAIKYFNRLTALVISNVNLGLENVTDRRYTDHYVNIQYTLECCNSIANYIDFEKLSNDVQMIT